MNKREKFIQRKKRVTTQVKGSAKRPRLVVFRSNKYIYAQIVNDDTQKTLVAATSKDMTDKSSKTQKAQKVGEEIAKKAKVKKITRVVFDKSGYRYQGRVKALADGARRGGLVF